MSPERLQDILEDEARTAALEQKLYDYPGATKQSVAARMTAYELRVMRKQEYLAAGYDNAAAEVLLDRGGYPRLPGWHSVFFYPESNRLRNRYVVTLAAIVLLALWTLV